MRWKDTISGQGKAGQGKAGQGRARQGKAGVCDCLGWSGSHLSRLNHSDLPLPQLQQTVEVDCGVGHGSVPCTRCVGATPTSPTSAPVVGVGGAYERLESHQCSLEGRG